MPKMLNLHYFSRSLQRRGLGNQQIETMRSKKGSKVVRLKKGSKVEVFCTSKTIPKGFWRPAQIVCGNGHTYTVRYNYLSSSPNHMSDLEKVQRKAIRPCPPVKEKLVKWAVDDIVEVFVHGSWKVGRVAGVAYGNNFYFVTLMGHGRELAVKTSNLRRRHLWQDNKWILMKNDSGHNEMKKQKSGAMWSEGVSKEPQLANGKVMLGERCGYNLCRSESTVSSTGSCSTSGRPDHYPVFSYCEDDAVSSFVPVRETSLCEKEEDGHMEKEAHKLALDAYHATMVALHAKGFISWEQEEMLSNLRLSLNISIDEQQSVLRSLASSR
ncbi:Plant Tudor-like RNA-binding protein [Rhynchospora pubera]|uniref:Plant Tudor-like RNA-binding protein n=1 Tax=Rhynchospora pubera TaxID=906938 RepID=A0AAV8F7G3_9POAL|nr:Plant Tudor-like RNA-binding protein [Rhynchospora pubera]